MVCFFDDSIDGTLDSISVTSDGNQYGINERSEDSQGWGKIYDELRNKRFVKN